MFRGSAALLGALVLSVAACAQPTDEGGDRGDRLRVVAGFYPIAEAAEQIGGAAVEVDNLTPPGAEPHDLELSSDAVDTIIDADVVVYLGEGFQPALEDAVARTEGVVLDLLEGETLIQRGEDEHADEEEHAEEEEGAHDPHVWLDPQRWGRLVQRIGSALADADPDRADAFGSAARAYADELAELDEEFNEALGDCDRNTIVTSHAAFGYLADRYDLVQESISGVSPEAEPDPRRLSELAELVEREGVTTIYTETLVSPAVAETLAREAGVEVGTLNPIEGLTEEEVDDGEDYASVMRQNLGALRDGLGCAD